MGSEDRDRDNHIRFQAEVAADLKTIRRDVNELRQERDSMWKILRKLQNDLTGMKARLAVSATIGSLIGGGAVAAFFQLLLRSK